MNKLLYLFFAATGNLALAQSPIPDTLNKPEVSYPFGMNADPIKSDSVYFYIDGIKVRAKSVSRFIWNAPEVTVIESGLPAHYGDINSSIIWIRKDPESCPEE